MCTVENRFKGMGVQRGEEVRGHAIILPSQGTVKDGSPTENPRNQYKVLAQCL